MYTHKKKAEMKYKLFVPTRKWNKIHPRKRQKLNKKVEVFPQEKSRNELSPEVPWEIPAKVNLSTKPENHKVLKSSPDTNCITRMQISSHIRFYNFKINLYHHLNKQLSQDQR